MASVSPCGPPVCAHALSACVLYAASPVKTNTAIVLMAIVSAVEWTKMLTIIASSSPTTPMKKNAPHDVRSRLVTRP